MAAIDQSDTSSAGRSMWSVIRAPALVTLGITLLRLVLEFAHAPMWLASRDAGGQGAVIGISWLPLILGPWFAVRVRTPGMRTGALLKKLLKTLLAYGWAARVPVVAVALLGLAFGWDTHFNKFGPREATMSMGMKIGATFGSQLIFWACVWTPVVGGISGMVWHALTKPAAQLETAPRK